MLKRLILALALARAPLASAQADTLTAGQAKTTALADWYANIYYTVVEGTYQVVIALAPGPQGGGRPMRVVHGGSNYIDAAARAAKQLVKQK